MGEPIPYEDSIYLYRYVRKITVNKKTLLSSVAKKKRRRASGSQPARAETLFFQVPINYRDNKIFITEEGLKQIEESFYDLHRIALLIHITDYLNSGRTENAAVDDWMLRLAIHPDDEEEYDRLREQVKKISLRTRQKTGQLLQRGQGKNKSIGIRPRSQQLRIWE